MKVQAGTPGGQSDEGSDGRGCDVLDGEGMKVEGSIRAQSNSDWAANRVTRRSVNGGALYFGIHLLRSWSKEQGLIALSSEEAELYAANFAAQQALGLKAK